MACKVIEEFDSLLIISKENFSLIITNHFLILIKLKA